jgi:energy-coupling factor transporter ATP-binding protein EcfA2
LLNVEGVVLWGPPPLGLVDIPLEPGLTALYGRNGSGKTRILRGLRTAFEEVEEGWHDGDFVLPDQTSFIYGAPLDSQRVATQILEGIDEWLLTAGPAIIEPTSVLEQLTFLDPARMATARFLVERWLRTPGTIAVGLSEEGLRDEMVAILNEAVGRGVFIVAPFRPNKRDWAVDFAVQVDQTTPHLRSALDRVCDQWGEFRRAHGAGEAEWEVDFEFAEELETEWSERWAETLCRSDFFTVFGQLADALGESWFGMDAAGEFSVWRAEEWYQHYRQAAPVVELTGFDPVGSLTFGNMGFHDFLIVEGSSWGIEEADERTWDEIRWRARGRQFLLGHADGDVVVAPWIQEMCRAASDAVFDLYEQLLPEAPRLECVLREPQHWAQRTPVHWEAIDLTGARVDLADLSSAQQRLAGYAIALGSPAAFRPSDRGRRTDTTIYLLDEPEAGLHALAERHAAHALATYAKEHALRIVTATHSRDVLGDPDANLIEVFRGVDGRTHTRAVEFPQSCRAEVLGVSRADLLQLYRVIVILEGHHDEVVLDELIGDRLRRAGALVIPLHQGSRMASVADAQLIADTLTVPVLVVLDNTNTDVVAEYWKALAATPPSDTKAHDEAQERLPSANAWPERNYITALARRLHAKSQLARVTVFGLGAADITEYLPAERLVPGATSWADLREAHAEALKRKGTAKDFKTWLTLTLSASFQETELRLACAALDSVPTDFDALAERVEELGSRPR